MLTSRCRPKGKIGFCFVETWLHIRHRVLPGCKWLQCLFLSWIKEINYRCPEYLPKQPSKLEETMVDLRLFLHRRRALCSCCCVNKRAAFEADRRSESFVSSFSFSGRCLAFSPSWKQGLNAEENLKSALISPWETQFLPVDKFLLHFWKD